MRIWRLHANDETEWIDARPLHPADRVGSFTFVRSDPAGGSPSWAAGHYRVDLLAADQLYSIAVQIPGRFGSVPAPDDWPATEANLVGPEESDPSGVQIGPFATVDGIGVPLATRPHELMSAGGSLAPEHRRTRVASRDRTLRPRTCRERPGSESCSRITPTSELAIVRRIAPDARFLAAPMLGGISALRGRTPYVAFAPRAGGAWPPGVYAITVRWTDAAGLHARTWHIELRPGLPWSSVVAR